MSQAIHRRRAARQDLVQIFRYYARAPSRDLVQPRVVSRMWWTKKAAAGQDTLEAGAVIGHQRRGWREGMRGDQQIQGADCLADSTTRRFGVVSTEPLFHRRPSS